MHAIDRARLPWRHWLPGLVIFPGVLASSFRPARAQESQTLRLAVGGTKVITLKDNPSTGYGWQLNNAASRNLSRVGIVDGGLIRDSTLVGAPGQRRFGITARQRGTAVVVFDYSRPWEKVAPARQHTITIKIGR